MVKPEENILEIRGLKTYFYTDEGVVRAVNDINLHLAAKKTLGIVGESGSGKTQTALSILRLIPCPPGKILEGEILFKGEDLLKKEEDEMRLIRGAKISMIFQDPMTSLNPIFTIEDQVAEAIRLHQRVTNKQELAEKVEEILLKVGISDAGRRLHDYPHQFSGGMRQRVMIAIALSCHPQLLIADEPTTNLDVTIQAQILELIKTLQKDFGTSIIYISHDLGVIAEIVENVAVMYAGRILEYSDVVTIFKKPRHPYTHALLTSVPRIDIERGKLTVIPGSVPNLIDLPPGCSFHPRCHFAESICRKEVPLLSEVAPNHLVACFREDKLKLGSI